MTNHPAIRAALMAATGTLALMVAACGAGSTGSSAQSGAVASASPSAGAGEVTTGDTGNGGGTTTTSPTPAKSPTPKTNTTTPAAPSGPVIVFFKISGNASCSESGPGFSAPGTVTLTWKVTGATKVGLSINDPTFYSKSGKGSFSDYPATDTQIIPFSCNVNSGQTATNQYTLDTLDGGAHKSMTIKASAVNHA